MKPPPSPSQTGLNSSSPRPTDLGYSANLNSSPSVAYLAHLSWFELRLKETEIVTLGSCLSGSLDVTRGDEIIGLTQSMLTAGAKSVAGSLWSVDDIATRVLFETFYSHVAVGESPAVAMQNAMQDVRKETNCAHPYYWAALSISGLAH